MTSATAPANPERIAHTVTQLAEHASSIPSIQGDILDAIIQLFTATPIASHADAVQETHKVTVLHPSTTTAESTSGVTKGKNRAKAHITK